MTNMVNFHTCAIGGVDLFLSIIFVTDCHFLQLTCDMICRSAIHIPIGVNTIGGSMCGGLLLVIIIIAIPTIPCTMAGLTANLIEDFGTVRSLSAVALCIVVVVAKKWCPPIVVVEGGSSTTTLAMASIATTIGRTSSSMTTTT